MPRLTIVAGPNGSGKTTLTRYSRELFQSVPILDPDAIARSFRLQGLDDSELAAGKEVLRQIEDFLSNEQSFLVETTLSGHTYMRTAARAKSLGYDVSLFFVGTANIEINLERVRYRVLKGGHDVPEEDQRRRYPRSFANLPKLLALADEAELLDNSSATGYMKVAEKAEGRFKVFEPVPAWAEFVREFV